MRRPAPEVLRTLVLVVVLATAGAGVAVVALSRPDGAPEPAPGAARSTTPGPGPGATLPEATATTCPARTEQVGLRVLTLNTHGARGPDGFGLDRLAAFIEASGVDVALLQEVDRFRGRSRRADMPRVLAARTGMHVAYGLNVHLPGRAVSGTATLSRFPILSRHNLRLPVTPGHKPRGLLRTDLDVDGVRVSVLNTHLEHLDAGLRRRQAAALRAPITATRHPVVLGGDFNAVPGSRTLTAPRALLADGWEEVGRGPGETAPARNPGRRIDHLYHSPTVRVAAIEVLPGLVSDHRAVRARYVLTVAGDRVCVPGLEGPTPGSGAGGGAAGRSR